MSVNKPVRKIILAYSGGLDTSVMLHWLKKTHDCEIVAYCADVGQNEELDGLEEKALKTGASKLYVANLQDEFVKDYVFTAVKAQAVYEGCYLMGTSLARPLIAKKQIEIAIAENADAVAHGATGKGNDQVRFELTYYSLKPDVKVIAPWREWSFGGRSDLIAYAKEHNIDVPVTAEKPYSMDRNLMHISYEGGILEDPWAEPPDNIFKLTQSVVDAPDAPTYVEIEFEAGEPVAVDGKLLGPADLLKALNHIGGVNGVGRVDIVENRYVGIKSRGVYETPGVHILHVAHRALESITLDREAMHLRDSLNTKISETIYNGYWFSPEFAMIKAMLNEMQKPVSGVVRLKIQKGNCWVVGRKSPNSLYSPTLATFEEDKGYNQAEASGFIKLNALRLKARRAR
jgi:argininosuccinate synthase